MSERTLNFDYKETVRTPKTDFPMRAKAAVRELEIQRFWDEQRIYEHLAEHNPGDLFILHDGPLYANGDLHVGHALNRTLKDIINRYQFLQGRKVRFVPGWDCHGLPIELKVLQAMKREDRAGLTPLQLRRHARDYALAALERQRASFRRYGVWGDWQHPYLTLQPEYEAAQIGVFGKMVLKGYIYRGLKPVHWSPSSQTALAEAELEYPEGHISRSIYVKFPVHHFVHPNTATCLAAALLSHLEDYRDTEEDLPGALLGEGGQIPDISIAIWTTTPWTIPGNLAICLNGGLDYAVVHSPTHGFLIVAEALVEKLGQTFATSFETLMTFKGSELEGTVCLHPLYTRISPVILGEHVTIESGTGAVHTAPGHGLEDYKVGQHYGLDILAPVDDYGRFTEDVERERRASDPALAGLAVLEEGNGAVIEALKAAGALLKEETYPHKYPYDWRTKKPTIFRATTQWFVSVADFRELALDAIKNVGWVPASGENRITAMVKDRTDWCISRQRAWGLPIPVFYCENCNGVLLSEESLETVQSTIRTYGSDIWWEKEAHELLPAGATCAQCGGHTFRKEKDIMDVWFDSGSSWSGVLSDRDNLRYPADLYLEGSDQHRGWFQSSLLTSIATEEKAPYRKVITHGFVLDESGRKMSKSLGNVVDPQIVIEGGKNQKQDPAYGADVLRLWVSSVDYTADVPLGRTILGQMADVYRKIRNTARYLLGSLYDFVPERDQVDYDALPEIDCYLLQRLDSVIQEVTEAFETYQFSRFFQTVQNFCTVDLSNFYLDISKDRLYISAEKSLRRRSCQTVLSKVLDSLVRLVAPVLPHLAEDIWQYMPYRVAHQSVFQAGWVRSDSRWHRPDLSHGWQKLTALRDEVNTGLEALRKDKTIGASLEARVRLEIREPGLYAEAERMRDELRYLFIVSQVELLLVDGEPGGPTTITILQAEGDKCERCWNYSVQVGTFEDHPTLCERCVGALAGSY